MLQSLALFPLQTVLFPGCLLDLQLFEPRYLDMLSRCLRQGSGFGVVALLEGGEVGASARRLSALGCEAEVCDWQQLPNGLLGVRVRGARRFRLHDWQAQPDQLLLGDIDWLAEQADIALQAEHEELLLLREALACHPQVADLLAERRPRGLQALTWELAYLLPLQRDEKLRLLAQDDPCVRCTQLRELLEQLQG